MAIGTPSARRSRCQCAIAVPSSTSRARATPGPALSRRASSVLDSGFLPRRSISSVYAESRICMSIKGLVTNVPRPAIRSSRPCATRASMACRTVIRATPNCSARSRSEGAGVPGSALTITERTYSRTSTCLRPRLPLPRGECSSTTGELLLQVVTRNLAGLHRGWGQMNATFHSLRSHSVSKTPCSLGSDGLEHVETCRATSREAGREQPDHDRSQQVETQVLPRDPGHLETLVTQGGHQGDTEDETHADTHQRPQDGNRNRLQTHHPAHLSAIDPDGPQQSDLAGALDDGER